VVGVDSSPPFSVADMPAPDHTPDCCREYPIVPVTPNRQCRYGGALSDTRDQGGPDFVYRLPWGGDAAAPLRENLADTAEKTGAALRTEREEETAPHDEGALDGTEDAPTDGTAATTTETLNAIEANVRCRF